MKHAVLNRIYRLVWKESLGAFVAVAEIAKGRGKRSSRGLMVSHCGALLLSLGMGMVQANPELPTAGKVTSGSASISQDGARMDINQASQKAAINWQTFNIGKDAAVNFNQPSRSAITLNRVLTQDPSKIAGQLKANGQVFIVNPNGVIFSQDAQVNVGGLVASTRDISDENFNKNRYQFDGHSQGAVINQGEINTRKGGYAALIGASVINEGSITAPRGDVQLAAANTLTIQLDNGSLTGLTVEQGTFDALVKNKGILQAEAGQIFLTAEAFDDLTKAVVNNEGIIEASGVDNRNGVIVLNGDMQSGEMQVSGEINVANSNGQGGKIVATAKKVSIEDDAQLNATGKKAGGEIYVGGGWQGGGIAQATQTTVKSTAVLDASATDKGDGGTIVAWSNVHDTDSATRAYGNFFAQGGSKGGDGGRIETSGYWLDTAGVNVKATASQGASGLWLLDPSNITINTSTTNGSFSGANPDVFTASASTSTVNAATINSTLGNDTSVTITTASSSGSSGNITVSADISKSAGSGSATLRLVANKNIVVNNSISASSGSLNLSFDNEASTQGVVILKNSLSTNGGNVTFNKGAYINRAGGTVITTAGGNVTFNQGTLLASTDGNPYTINTSGGGNNGAVNFNSTLNSANTYAAVGCSPNCTWGTANTNATSGSGTGVGHTYLATILSATENEVASSAANFTDAWLGGARVNPNDGTGTTDWRWQGGPEKSQSFYSSPTTGGTSTLYTNWNPGEPNNSGGEDRLQFTGTAGKWNDLNSTSHTLAQFVKETNLAATPLTINAGSAATVTFGGAVGTSNALGAMNITANTVAINGGAVTTTGAQAYTGNSTLGSSATTLTQTNVNTDFTLQANKTLTNATGSAASLTLKTTRDIILDTSSSISSATGALTTVFQSDSDATDGGAILLKQGSSISSNGGSITLSGGTNTATGYAQGRSSVADLTNGITLLNSSITSNGGNIIMRGKGASIGAAGSHGSTTAYGIGLGLASNTSTNVTIDSNSATITMEGISQSNDGLAFAHGVEIGTRGTSATGFAKLNSTNNTANAIAITGNASASSASNGAAGIVNFETVQTLNGGGIALTGVGGAGGGIHLGVLNQGKILSNSGAITLTGTEGVGGSNEGISFNNQSKIGLAAGTDVTVSNSNITLVANTMLMDGNLASSGSITLKPRTAGTTVAIGGGTGTLSLPGTAFSNNILNGFSSITIGDSATGAITLGNTTAFNDHITLISNSNINLNSNLTAAGQTVTLTGGNGASVSGNGSISADSLLLNGSGANYTLTAPSNGVITLAAAGAASVNFKNNNSLTVGTVGATNGVTASGNITLEASGANSDLTLNKAVTTTSGTINLAAGRNFINNMSSNTGIVPGSGRYLVYSADPAISTEGMSSYNKHYNQTYTANSTPSYATSGNWFLYSIAPTISVTADNKSLTYSTADPTLTAAYSGFIDGDTSAVLSGAPNLAANFTASSAGYRPVGSYTITTGTGTLTDSLGYQYSTTNGTVTVNAKTLTATYAGVNKVYDGATTATVTTSDDRVSGDVLSIARTATFNNKNVGTGKTISVSSASLSGTDAANYALSATTGSTTANITAKNLTVSATGSNKVYDGATTATASLSDDRVSGDSLTVSKTGAAFANKNVGTGKTVTVSGLTLSGTDATNYNLAASSATTTANITAKSLTLSATAADKTYDATTAANVTFSDDRVSGDSLTVSKTGAAFANKNVGTGKTVTVSGLTLSGTDATNYSLAASSATTTANITAKSLTLSATAADKTYDATTAANVTFSDDRVSGDSLTVSKTSATFSNKNAGTAKTVTVNGLSISGTDAANYSLAATSTTSLAAIIAKALTASYSASNKVYDGNTTASVSGSSSDIISGDVLSLGQTAVFDTKNAGTGKTVNISNIALSGTDAGNYNLQNTTASATADTTSRAISFTADKKTKMMGTTDPSLLVSISSGSLATDDSLDEVTGTLTRESEERMGDYDVMLGTGSESGNYVTSFNANNNAFSITASPLLNASVTSLPAIPSGRSVTGGYTTTDTATIINPVESSPEVQSDQSVQNNQSDDQPVIISANTLNQLQFARTFSIENGGLRLPEGIIVDE